MDQPGDRALPAPPAVLPAPFPFVGGRAGALVGPAAQARKLKLSAVLDPTLDAEIQPLTDVEVTQMHERYRTRYGDLPSTDADVSRDQLAALSQVIASGVVPYADFSIFGPPASKANLPKLHFGCLYWRVVEEGTARALVLLWVVQGVALLSNRHAAPGSGGGRTARLICRAHKGLCEQTGGGRQVQRLRNEEEQDHMGPT